MSTPSPEAIPIEVHSWYSAGQGIESPETMVSRAATYGLPFVGAADTGGFYGLPLWLGAARRAGLPLLIGVRLNFTVWGHSELIIAGSRTGYEQLAALISAGHLNRAEDFQSIITAGHEDWLVIYPHSGPPESSSAPKHSYGRSQAMAEVDVTRPDYYTCLRYFRAEAIPYLVHQPVYFLQPSDHHSHRLFSAIHHQCPPAQLDHQLAAPGAWFQEPAQLVAERPHLAEEFARTSQVAQQYLWDFGPRRWIFPRSGPEEAQALKAICQANIAKRFEAVAHPAARQRLLTELDIIVKSGFAGYFLIMHDIVRRFPLTCGRGSAAASVVSYLLYITHVDPIAHNLYFERFLHSGRTEPPDIDVDFPWDVKEEVARYVLETYGERAAMVANHITFSVRSSVREVARLEGLGSDEITQVTRHLDYYYDRHQDVLTPFQAAGAGPPGMVQASPEAEATVQPPPPPGASWPEIMGRAAGMQGAFRFLGLHCGGVVVAPRPIDSYVPRQLTPKGLPAVQVDKDGCEDLGLVKIDLLGNRSLAVVRDTLAAVAKQGVQLSYADLNPLTDGAVMRAMAEGRTIGVFYAESPAMRQLQRKTKRGDYEHLVLHSSIIRPAASGYVREYIARLKGKEWQSLFPELDELLAESYGLMSYQEDISKAARTLAGFSIEDADRLRKVISNKKRSREKRGLKFRFFKNMLSDGRPRQKIQALWDMIESFSGYSFCKPHSASYALLTFKACWLKVYHPAEFMAAVLTNQGGFYAPAAYIAEARRMGLRVEAPEINHSRAGFWAEGRTIWAGLMIIKGLPQADMEAIEDEAQQRPFTSLADFVRRMPARPATLELLIRAGCFRNLETAPIPALLARAAVAFRHESQPTSAARQGSLFSPPPSDGQGAWGPAAKARHLRESRAPGGPGSRPGPSSGPAKHRPTMSLSGADRRWQWTDQQALYNEWLLYGFVLSEHPVGWLRRKGHLAGTTTSREVDPQAYGDGGAPQPGREVTVCGLLVTAKPVLTKDEHLMKFVTFEDEFGLIEGVLFPETFARFGRLLLTGRPYRLQGIVDTEFDVPMLNIQWVSTVGWPWAGTSLAVDNAADR